MGNQVCRYTMLTRPPEPMLSAILGASGAAKMPFYEAADHVFASPLQLDHIHAYTHTCILARSSHGPRVRRNTGEMFQSTRLKGQLTPSCLAARIVVVPSALFTCCPPSCFVALSLSYPRRSPFVVFSSRSFFFSSHFLGVHRVSRYIHVTFKATFATTRNI